jgi:hypothetical protein
LDRKIFTRDEQPGTVVDNTPPEWRRKLNYAWLMQKVVCANNCDQRAVRAENRLFSRFRRHTPLTLCRNFSANSDYFTVSADHIADH